ncbi:alpha/beta fold hydrolase [Candidatus Leptofilum sp.]|uniref:alpha/beta fold hydrolase n=1 Tax=Candidatus Leptofilum sp. TaxID=3241576 RepID=UPI003B5B48E9
MKTINSLTMFEPQQTVVCLHASASTSHQWHPLSQCLANKPYRFVAPDLYGYGQGPSPNGTFSMDDEVQLVLDNLYDDESFHLIGHSYGGSVALRVAQCVPERILSLTLFEPVSFGYLKANDMVTFTAVKKALGKTAKSVDRGDFVAAASHFINYWSGAQAFEQMPSSLQKMIVNCMPKVGLERQGLFGDCVDVMELAALAMPTLLLSGRQSTKAAQVLVGILHRALPSSDLIRVARLGHMAPVTNPDVVNPYIVDFLESISEVKRPLAMIPSIKPKPPSSKQATFVQRAATHLVQRP